MKKRIVQNKERNKRRKIRRIIFRIKLSFIIFATFFSGYFIGSKLTVKANAAHKNSFMNSLFVDTSSEIENSDQWNLMLVNYKHAIPENYQIQLKDIGQGHSMDYRAADAFLEMNTAAKADGIYIQITSSYRTMEKQQQLFRNKTSYYINEGYSKQEAEELAGRVVAVPGTSEHQLGLALDLVSEQYSNLDEGQESTDVFQWLVRNCADYGFILRYPESKTEITGIIYEPWHFRYVGVEAAKEIMNKGICLEEYLEM